jgi:hypothetical protein
MIAIPSESADERAVIERVGSEMADAGFDEIKVDGLGNILGRVGSGPTVIAIDGHVDTVGVGDPVHLVARSVPGRPEGRHRLRPRRGRPGGGRRGGGVRRADLPRSRHGDECQLWVTATVMEEDCDGLCWQYILREGS